MVCTLGAGSLACSVALLLQLLLRFLSLCRCLSCSPCCRLSLGAGTTLRKDTARSGERDRERERLGHGPVKQAPAGAVPGRQAGRQAAWQDLCTRDYGRTPEKSCCRCCIVVGWGLCKIHVGSADADVAASVNATVNVNVSIEGYTTYTHTHTPTPLSWRHHPLSSLSSLGSLCSGHFIRRIICN